MGSVKRKCQNLENKSNCSVVLAAVLQPLYLSLARSQC